MNEVLLFTESANARCYSLKEELARHGIEFEEVDVGTPEGLALAAFYECGRFPAVVIKTFSQDIVLLDPDVSEVLDALGK